MYIWPYSDELDNCIYYQTNLLINLHKSFFSTNMVFFNGDMSMVIQTLNYQQNNELIMIFEECYEINMTYLKCCFQIRFQSS